MMKTFTVEPLLAEGENIDRWKYRNLEKGQFKMTFAVGGAPLTFKRR
jgi:hypothetical protein